MTWVLGVIAPSFFSNPREALQTRLKHLTSDAFLVLIVLVLVPHLPGPSLRRLRVKPATISTFTLDEDDTVHSNERRYLCLSLTYRANASMIRTSSASKMFRMSFISSLFRFSPRTRTRLQFVASRRRHWPLGMGTVSLLPALRSPLD